MNRNLRWHVRIANIFLTLALETMSEAWGGKAAGKVLRSSALEDLVGLDRRQRC